jgi:hypothetical protein
LPISAVDTITLAFQHTRRQLLQPFRFWQWTRLAIVGLLAGEAGSSGGFNFPTNFNIPIPRHPNSSENFFGAGLPNIDPATLSALIAVMVVAGLVFVVMFAYVSSVMRFILFDSVLAKECHIRQGWNRRHAIGWKYFLWQIGFMLVVFTVLAVLLGVPAAIAYAMGWFRAPGEHVLALVLGGIALFFVFLIFFVAAAVVQVLTKDFVVPQMALEGIGAIEGWRRLWPMIDSEKSGYAVYIGMKIVLAISAGIIVGIVGLILGLIIAIPTVGLAIVAAITGKTAGLTWNVFTITAAIVVGSILFAIFLYLIALISVPVTVFFPAYSIYFFAPRYRPLSLVLYPPPPAMLDPGSLPPSVPPLTPSPAV